MVVVVVVVLGDGGGRWRRVVVVLVEVSFCSGQDTTSTSSSVSEGVMVPVVW